jgi:septal ring factor EnvC (AmiA/AmiB activator)
MTDYLTLAVTLASALGGIELLKMFFNWKTNRQKESLTVTDANLEVIKKQIGVMQERTDYLDAELKERNEKIGQLHRDVRARQEEKIVLMGKISELEIKLERAAYWKCLVCKCTRRKPPQLELEAEEEAAQ